MNLRTVVSLVIARSPEPQRLPVRVEGERVFHSTVPERPAALFFTDDFGTAPLLWVAETYEPLDQEQPTPPPPNDQEPKTKASPVADDYIAPLQVLAEHDAGWAAAYRVNDFNGDLVGASGNGELVSPERVIVIGERVRGFAMFFRLGTWYAALTKCSYAKGYRCRMEFHILDPAFEQPVNGHSGSYILDSGLPSESSGSYSALRCASTLHAHSYTLAHSRAQQTVLPRARLEGAMKGDSLKRHRRDCPRRTVQTLAMRGRTRWQLRCRFQLELAPSPCIGVPPKSSCCRYSTVVSHNALASLATWSNLSVAATNRCVTCMAWGADL